MQGIYEKITRWFLQAFDPYHLSDCPPDRHLWPYLKSHIKPMRLVIASSVLVTIFAASIEVWLIQYAGQIVDKLVSSNTGNFWQTEGTELLFAAVIVLLLRPIAQFLRLAVNDISFSCNAATLVRWRAYDHLIRQSVGMVTQQAALLNRSVRDNILLGREDVSNQELVSFATRARAHSFIVELNDKHGRSGYDAHVGERGVKLSGGQRQRVAIARVILKNSPILILDEATSAQDSEVESEIQESLIDVMQDKMVIAIAHRLSTIARMDRIIVLDRGKIVEEGTHTDLIAISGLYASFWRHQSDGFIGIGQD